MASGDTRKVILKNTDDEILIPYTEVASSTTAGRVKPDGTTTSVDANGAISVTGKQDTLVSGTNIKTINGASVLGSGDLTVQATSLPFSAITGQPSDNTNLANALNAKANTDLSNLTSTGKNIANWSNNVTNCITEIPQDIKLELNNGTLTLKAGSKVYVPNGFESDGTTPRFDVYTTTTDYTADTKEHSGIYFIGANRSTGLLNSVSTIQNCISGTNAPSSPTALQGWYDTTNNIIKRYQNGSEQTFFRCSFPLCYVTSDGTNITSIDQVFNGFGYIGSTVFALPGVKGLIPNGRNADGTLKNTEFETIQVNIHTQAVEQDYAHIYLASNFIFPSNVRNYNNEENYNYNINSGNIENNICEVGNLTRTSTSPYAITSLTPKTAFHAVDYNDFSDLKDDVDTKANDSAVVKLSGNQTIAGIKTFLDQLYFKNGGTYSTTPASIQMYGNIRFKDSTGKDTGVIDNYTDTDGTTHIRLYAYLPTDISKYSIIDLSVDKNGNWNTYVPTPATSSNNNNIATTAYVNNKMQVVTALPASPTAGVFYFVKE